MVTIANTLGVGSGIDTASLVTNLVAAQRSAKDAALTARTTANTAKISALATVTSSIDNFSTSLNTLIAGGTLYTQPTASDPSIAAISAVAGTRLGDLSADLEVKQLAEPQTLVASGLASSSTTVGQGTLTFKLPSGSYDVTIDATNDSLGGLAKAINAKNIGIAASIVTDSSGARLVLKGQTGAVNAFSVTTADGAADGLRRFTFDTAGGASSSSTFTAAKTAKDAIVVLDGVETTRASNSITDLIAGTMIDLAKAAPGTTIKIGSTRPTAAIGSAISDFVAAYNDLATQLTTATAAAATDGTGGGALRGDRGITQARQLLSKLTSTALTASGSGPRTLAEIGVSTNRDGTLTLDSTRLNAQLDAYPDAIEAMFNPSQSTDSPFLSITSKFGAAKAGTYTVTNVTTKTDTAPASGTIAGKAAVTGGGGVRLVADLTSAAAGLSLLPTANVASATVTVELGLGGALQAVRDALRGTTGALTGYSARFANETTAIAKEKTIVDARSAAYQARLAASFTTMDAKVAQYKATQSYLTQQIDLWTKSS